MKLPSTGWGIAIASGGLIFTLPEVGFRGFSAVLFAWSLGWFLRTYSDEKTVQAAKDKAE